MSSKKDKVVKAVVISETTPLIKQDVKTTPVTAPSNLSGGYRFYVDAVSNIYYQVQVVSIISFEL